MKVATRTKAGPSGNARPDKRRGFWYNQQRGEGRRAWPKVANNIAQVVLSSVGSTCISGNRKLRRTNHASVLKKNILRPAIRIVSAIWTSTVQSEPRMSACLQASLKLQEGRPREIDCSSTPTLTQMQRSRTGAPGLRTKCPAQ